MAVAPEVPATASCTAGSTRIRVARSAGAEPSRDVRRKSVRRATPPAPERVGSRLATRADAGRTTGAQAAGSPDGDDGSGVAAGVATGSMDGEGGSALAAGVGAGEVRADGVGVGGVLPHAPTRAV